VWRSCFSLLSCPAKIAHGGNLVCSGNLSKSVENPAHFPKVEYLAKPFVIDSAITGGEDGHGSSSRFADPQTASSE